MATPEIATEDDDEQTDEQTTEEEATTEETTAADSTPETQEDDTVTEPTTETEDETEEETETEETTPDDDEEEPVEEVELPEDADEVDDESPGGSLLGGTTFGISNKVLLGAGVAAVIGVLIIREMNRGPKNASKDRYETEEDMEAELEEGSPAAAEKDELQAGGSPAFSETAQQSAIDEIFG